MKKTSLPCFSLSYCFMHLKKDKVYKNVKRNNLSEIKVVLKSIYLVISPYKELYDNS